MKKLVNGYNILLKEAPEVLKKKEEGDTLGEAAAVDVKVNEQSLQSDTHGSPKREEKKEE